MSGSLTVKISSRKSKTGQEVWEGTANLSSKRVRPTKLQKQDGATEYTTRSAVSQAAQKLATELNLTLKLDEKTPVKKAAKKSTKNKTAASNTGSCGGNGCTPPWMQQ